MDRTFNWISKKSRFAFISSALIILLTLLISWLVWNFLYNSNLNQILNFFSTSYFIKQNDINLTFTNLTIFVFSFFGLLLLFALPFIFCKRKRAFANFILLLNFILTAVFISIALLFIAKTYSMYNSFYKIYGLNDTLLWFLPWSIILLFSFILLVTSLLSLVLVYNDNKDKKIVNSNKKKSKKIVDKDMIIIDSKKKNNDETKVVLEKIDSQTKKNSSKKNEVQKLKQENDTTKSDYSFVETQLTPFTIGNNQKIDVESLQNSKWTIEQIDQSWEKAKKIDGINPNLYRKDHKGDWMFKKAFISDVSNVGNKVDDKKYAWTIVKIKNDFNKIEDSFFPVNIININKY